MVRSWTRPELTAVQWAQIARCIGVLLWGFLLACVDFSISPVPGSVGWALLLFGFVRLRGV
jgi:hypothetical protein